MKDHGKDRGQTSMVDKVKAMTTPDAMEKMMHMMMNDDGQTDDRHDRPAMNTMEQMMSTLNSQDRDVSDNDKMMYKIKEMMDMAMENGMNEQMLLQMMPMMKAQDHNDDMMDYIERMVTGDMDENMMSKLMLMVKSSDHSMKDKVNDNRGSHSDQTDKIMEMMDKYSTSDNSDRRPNSAMSDQLKEMMMIYGKGDFDGRDNSMKELLNNYKY